jgi:hypothetical protein
LATWQTAPHDWREGLALAHSFPRECARGKVLGGQSQNLVVYGLELREYFANRPRNLANWQSTLANPCLFCVPSVAEKLKPRNTRNSIARLPFSCFSSHSWFRFRIWFLSFWGFPLRWGLDLRIWHLVLGICPFRFGGGCVAGAVGRISATLRPAGAYNEKMICPTCLDGGTNRRPPLGPGGDHRSGRVRGLPFLDWNRAPLFLC